MKKLTQDEWTQLDVQYSNTPDLADSFSASGQHYLLVMVLNKLKFYPHTREEAFEIAERLLSNGYKT